MNGKTWSFYDTRTGIIKSRWVGISAADGLKAVENNTPPDCKAIPGRFDHLSQRVDLETGKVVDYVPPKPNDDHEWHAESKRWVRKPELIRAEIAERQARQQIANIELSNQRAIRDALLVLLEDGPEKDRIAQAEADIAVWRSVIQV